MWSQPNGFRRSRRKTSRTRFPDFNPWPRLGLAERALSAANKTPDIRPEAVERGRALIAKPVDVEQLSDAMVYRLLESWKTE